MDSITSFSNAPLEVSEEHTQQNNITVVSYSFILEMDIAPREFLIEPFLTKASTCLMYAKRGVGKTYFSFELIVALAYGKDFLNFKIPKPRQVLYIDGEMSLVAVQERLAAIELRMPENCEMIEPLFITPDLQEGTMPNLSTPKGQNQLDKVLDSTHVDLVVIDNLSTLCSFGKENESESWLPIQQLILSLRKRGIALLIIHHAGKDGSQRGTSKREDIVDVVICLKQPSDYQPSEGAKFELHYQKARSMLGEDVKPILCHLTDQGWVYSFLENSNHQKIIELSKEGLRNFEIAEELDLSKGYVSKVVKNAKNNGELF